MTAEDVCTSEDVKIDLKAVPDYAMDTLCRIVIGLTRRMFEDPEVRADYERWRKENEELGMRN